jgi:DtxR family Mn-dependent transcriptional regulator
MAKNYQSKLENPLSSAHEDYLKAIYVLEMKGEKVNNSALANYMGFAPASTTNMVKKLAQLNLVEYEPYQGVQLTRLGRQVALEVLRHHRLLELFLHETLAMSWDRVHEEAEKLEHVISEALEDAIAIALGHPTVDPHGDPIPSKDGQIARQSGIPLSSVAAQRPYLLVRVLHQDQERLHYLGSLGLYPGARVTVRERAPFNGPLLIDVEGEQHALAHDMAETLLVTTHKEDTDE